MYSYTALRISCTYSKYLLMTYVRQEKKTDLPIKKLVGDDKVIEAVTTPKRGRNRAKIIAQRELVGFFSV